MRKKKIKYIVRFLNEVYQLSGSTPLWTSSGTCGKNISVEKRIVEFNTDAKPVCPVNILLPSIVEKMSLDCTSFSIKGGEGLKLGYKKDFVSGQSTVSAGVGISYEAGAMGMEASVNADESFYITFDKNGNPTDAGLKFDAGTKLKVGNISTSAGLGYTMGMNSGWNFTANAFDAKATL